ncbi:MAG: NAD(P)-dependent oxidoreductase [Verrucomicrobia bacterium]|nr:NAD(P)-dependent oxidoreductase [Verrucomicrobiota bacterium]
MKVAIVGSKGLLGSALAVVCRKAGMGTIELAREQLDITQPLQVRERLPAVHWLINCAAFSDIDGAEKQRAKAFAINNEGARALSVSCQRRGIRLMHISCGSVFSGLKATPYTEMDEPNPPNTHGLSKLAGEKSVRAEGGKVLIVRLPVLFGNREGRWPAELLTAAREGRFPLKVPADEIVAPAYSRHVAEGLVRLLSLDVAGIVHVGAAGRCTWIEFAQALVARMSPGGEVVGVPSADFYGRVARPAHTVLDSQRFRQWTGHALPGWREGLEAWLNDAGDGLARKNA